ncbi:MAG: WD40 repeat domain-containing protein [Actinobacteria bacterium]|nr:WD40 repeat domain-containing protein [Actinomycetota bacterium]
MGRRQVAHRLDGHTGWVWSVGYNGDGTRIVSGGDDRTVRCGRRHGPSSATRRPHRLVWSVGFSGDGTRIVSGGENACGCGTPPGRRVHPRRPHRPGVVGRVQR